MYLDSPEVELIAGAGAIVIVGAACGIGFLILGPLGIIVALLLVLVALIVAGLRRA